MSRICMRGFPNRIPYNDFKKRYWVLGRDRLLSLDERSLVENVVTNCPNFPVERFRLGHTKVFFRAGALAALEEERDTVVTDLVAKLQGRVLGKLRRVDFVARLEKREMIVVIQRLFRNFSRFRSWKWWQLIRLTQPLIGGTNMEEVSFSLEVDVQQSIIFRFLLSWLKGLEWFAAIGMKQREQWEHMAGRMPNSKQRLTRWPLFLFLHLVV